MMLLLAEPTISRAEVDRMYTMDALDHVLAKNPEALQELPPGASFWRECCFPGRSGIMEGSLARPP